jgi:hypothetical protein
MHDLVRPSLQSPRDFLWVAEAAVGTLSLSRALMVCYATARRKMSPSKIAAVLLLSSLIALCACRREATYEPLKLGGPAAERPAR